MALPLSYYGAPILRKKTKEIQEITPEIKEFISKLKETLCSHDNGWGIAANQVGSDLRLFIIYEINDDEKGDPIETGNILTFINPKIVRVGEEENSMTEGCLSIPGIYEDVVRPTCVEVEGLDEDGKKIKMVYTNYKGMGIDVMDDLINARKIINA